MLREAGPDDAAALEAFLSRHAGTSMFLRGNLAAHGTQEREHRHGTRFMLREEGAEVVAVAGITNAGHIMCQAPGQSERFFEAVAEAFARREVAGLGGDPQQVAALEAALGLEGADFMLRRDLPLFDLELAHLRLPDMAMTLRAPDPADAEWLSDWFVGFLEETELAGASDGRDAAAAYVKAPDARLGVVEGKPVAMTNFNAKAFDTVQIGGVFVPLDQRGYGYGGAVVAQHLAEARKHGITRAILFAASEFAVRSYERIGFKAAGSYRLAMLRAPVVVSRRVVT